MLAFPLFFSGDFFIRISVQISFHEYIFGCMKINHKRFVMFFQIHNLQVIFSFNTTCFARIRKLL